MFVLVDAVQLLYDVFGYFRLVVEGQLRRFQHLGFHEFIAGKLVVFAQALCGFYGDENVKLNSWHNDKPTLIILCCLGAFVCRYSRFSCRRDAAVARSPPDILGTADT